MQDTQNNILRPFVNTGERWRSATLSLDGLLDYDESDKDEVTFEVSLFAEAFQDMLMRDFGQAIYESLLSFRSAQFIRRSKDLWVCCISRSALVHLTKSLLQYMIWW